MPKGTDIKTRFGQRLRELRQAKGLSQEELAFRAGLHRTYISSTERGQRNVALLNIEKLAAALEVGMADLFRAM
jgi:transcriptional regulator with XRE-family HTH domain